MMPGLVDAQRAHVNEALQRPALAGIEKDAQGVDVGGAVFLDGAAVAHLGGAVDDDIDAFERLRCQRRVAEVAALERDAQFFQGGHIAGGAGDGADGMAARDARFRDVAAHEAGGARDEIAHEIIPSAWTKRPASLR